MHKRFNFLREQSSTSTNLSVENSTEEIKAEVLENNEFEYLDLSFLIALSEHFRIISIPMQTRQSKY